MIVPVAAVALAAVAAVTSTVNLFITIKVVTTVKTEVEDAKLLVDESVQRATAAKELTKEFITRMYTI